MVQWKKLTVLPIVKAYPEPSKKYKTTVCVAAVTIPDGQWIRFYPLKFTEYPENRRFEKYQTFEVMATKNKKDPRPESYRIDEDTIHIVGERTDTKSNWMKRKEFLHNARVSSLCELQRRQKVCGKSLGMIKVGRVTDFRTVAADQEKYKAAGAQYEHAASPDLFNEEKLQVEPLPFKFQYVFHCTDPNCKRHKCSVIDWEAYALYKRMVYKWGKDKAVDKVRQKYVEDICGQDKDTYFYMGNMQAHPSSFLVLGAFYPKVSNELTLYGWGDLDPTVKTEVPTKSAVHIREDSSLFSGENK